MSEENKKKVSIPVSFKISEEVKLPINFLFIDKDILGYFEAQFEEIHEKLDKILGKGQDLPEDK